MEDNPDADEFLDYLCWSWAMDGQRFHPPKETAKDCMDSLMPETYEEGSTDYANAMGWEEGRHSRALIAALHGFRDAENYNLDPVERAAREHRDVMERADGEVEPLDWSWYHE